MAITSLLIGLGLCALSATMVLPALAQPWADSASEALPDDSQAIPDDSPLQMPEPPQTAQVPPLMASASTAIPDTSVLSQTEAIAAPTPSVTASPTSAPPPANLVNALLGPLIQEAKRRRAARESADPQGYARRIDKALNQDRINFLVYGYGTTNEPPQPPGYKGSIAIYSLNLRTLQIQTVTVGHDVRAPEVERYVRSKGSTPPPMKIHFAYPLGGFDLMRNAVEDATGLSVDFQFVFQDSLVKDIVDEVFGGLSVNVPFTFDAEAIYYQDVKYPVRRYAPGRQTMNGLQVLQFIKATQAQGTVYDPHKELAVRKQIVVQAALEAVKKESTNPLFWARLAGFLKATLDRKQVEYDFDAPTLVFQSIGAYVTNAMRGQPLRIGLGKSVYVADIGSGDGGVEWIGPSRNPIVQRDIANGVYVSDPYMSIPKGSADPYAPDLIANYWPAVRQLVRQWLR